VGWEKKSQLAQTNQKSKKALKRLAVRGKGTRTLVAGNYANAKERKKKIDLLSQPLLERKNKKKSVTNWNTQRVLHQGGGNKSRRKKAGGRIRKG